MYHLDNYKTSLNIRENKLCLNVDCTLNTDKKPLGKQSSCFPFYIAAESGSIWDFEIQLKCDTLNLASIR